MYSIAALLESENCGPWDDLATLCKYSGVQTHQIPHFSWQTAEDYKLSAVKESLDQLCETIPPFHFTTSGLGIFTGKRKILFLIIVKTRPLLEIHEALWNTLSVYAKKGKAFYSPENWIPHITLNLEPLTETEFNCSLSELEKHPLDFEFEVKKFGLIYLTAENSGIDSTYILQGITN